MGGVQEKAVKSAVRGAPDNIYKSRPSIINTTSGAAAKTPAGIGKIDIIPQDIGRVILNLLTNAFYAVNEKSKNGITGYEPTVSVNTKKTGDFVELSVGDNGNGIPQKVLDKIFQPFFTTKPAGEGSGLGLDIVKRIIDKHKGKIGVESKPGKTTFSVFIPIIYV